MSRTVVVSNRIPPLGEKSDDAQAGGLTVVLRDLLEAGGGLWLGWSGRIHATPGAPTLTTRGRVTYTTIDLTPAEHDGYYNGFSNGVLWPLLHLLPGLMRYNRADAEMYRRVNERLADTLLPQLRPDDAIWIQDYHLFPLAAALRTRGVNNRIGFFLHVPFPPSDVLSVIPGADRIVRDLLAADLVGFQTRISPARRAISAAPPSPAASRAPTSAPPASASSPWRSTRRVLRRPPPTPPRSAPRRN